MQCWFPKWKNCLMISGKMIKYLSNRIPSLWLETHITSFLVFSFGRYRSWKKSLSNKTKLMLLPDKEFYNLEKDCTTFYYYYIPIKQYIADSKSMTYMMEKSGIQKSCPIKRGQLPWGAPQHMVVIWKWIRSCIGMKVGEPISRFSNKYMAILHLLFVQSVSNPFKFFLKLQFLSNNVCQNMRYLTKQIHQQFCLGTSLDYI